MNNNYWTCYNHNAYKNPLNKKKITINLARTALRHFSITSKYVKHILFENLGL